MNTILNSVPLNRKLSEIFMKAKEIRSVRNTDKAVEFLIKQCEFKDLLAIKAAAKWPQDKNMLAMALDQV